MAKADEQIEVVHPQAGKARMTRQQLDKVYAKKGWREAKPETAAAAKARKDGDS